jgi:uncharacterized protein YkwD
LSNNVIMKISVFGCLFTILLLTGAKVFCQQSGTAEFKRSFLEHINKVRAEGCNCGTTYMPPVGPLTWNNDLQKSAEGHAWDMSNNNYFSHTSRDGRSMQDVFAGYKFNGYKSFAVGENIAFGQSSIDEVMDGWFKSPGHCKNLMNADFKEVGVAENHKYWVQDFGGREPFSSQQQRMIRSGQIKLIQTPMASH